MVACNRLEVVVVAGICFGVFTALLTMIRHRKRDYFRFWRDCSGVTLSHLYK